MASNFAIFLKCASFLASFLSSAAFFDIDEITNINYGIELIPKPVLLGELNSGAHHMILSTKHGQQYQCIFEDKNVQAEKQDQEEKTAKEIGIPELLKPMEDGPCLLANKGWWTYEFCYGKHIQQYHLEDGHVVGKVLVLGLYHSEYDWENQDKDKDKNERLRRYHSQNYSNGTQCDLTLQPRRSEVRFVCDDSTGDYISTIDESETCVYVITVHTPRICHHPYLKPAKTSKSVPITCNPVLNEHDYNIHLKQEEEKRKREEELEKQKAKYLEDAAKKLSLTDLFGEDADEGSVEGPVQDKMLQKFKDTMLNVIKKRSGQPDQAAGSGKAATEPRAGEAGEASEARGPEKADGEGDNEARGPEKADGEGEGDNDDDNDDDDDEDLFAEFDQGLEEIVADPVRRKMLPSLKEHIRRTMANEFGGILKEAEAELKEEGQEPVVDTKETFKSLANTLNRLLERMDKSTKDVTNMDQRLKDTEGFAKEGDEPNESRADLLKKLLKSDETSKDSIEPESRDNDPTDPGQDRVTVRVTKIRSEEDGPIKLGDENEREQKVELAEDQRRKLEEQVQDELKKAGLETKGQKIHVKIISTKPRNDGSGKVETLSEQDSKAFNKMIIAIMRKNADEDAAEEKQNNLVSAYNYRWRPDTESSETKSMNQDEEH